MQAQVGSQSVYSDGHILPEMGKGSEQLSPAVLARKGALDRSVDTTQRVRLDFAALQRPATTDSAELGVSRTSTSGNSLYTADSGSSYESRADPSQRWRPTERQYWCELWFDADGGRWFAEVPDVAQVLGTGLSEAEALEDAHFKLCYTIRHLLEQQWEVPKPSRRSMTRERSVLNEVNVLRYDGVLTPR